MRRKIPTALQLLLGAMCLLAASTSTAQTPIPNGGFELWTAGSPDGWTTDNNTSFSPITQSATAHGGSSALRGDVADLGVAGFTLPPTAFSGTVDQRGFACTDRPDQFTGFYQYHGVGSDTLQFLVAFAKNGTGVGAGVFRAGASATSYAAFTAPIVWKDGESPDTAIITLSIAGPNGTSAHVGSFFLADDLSFGSGNVGVNDRPLATLALGGSYPNPANTKSTITYSLEKPGYATLTLYDLAGRVVAAPVHENQAAGGHTANLNTSDLPAGVYAYRLTAGGSTLMHTMQVVR